MTDKKILLVVDDNRTFLDFAKNEIQDRYDCFEVRCYDNPLNAIKALNRPFDLLLLDWEMDEMDGRKFLNYARQIGVPYYKVIIISAHTAEKLHTEFKADEALAVINKSDPEQMKALYMIFDNVAGKRSPS